MGDTLKTIQPGGGSLTEAPEEIYREDNENMKFLSIQGSLCMQYFVSQNSAI